MWIFKKTLKDEFPITAIFCVILTITIFLIIQEFAIARYVDFSAFTQNMPKAIQRMAQAFLVLNIFGGYLHIVAGVNWTIITGIFVSLVSSSLISKEMEKKTLPLVLAHPISRFQVIFQKYLGFIIFLVFISFFSFLGFYLGIYHGFIDMPYNLKYITRAMINGFFFFLALSGIGLLSSVIFNEQKKAAITALLYFFLSYLCLFLSEFSPKWAKIERFTLFHFFNTEDLFFSQKFSQWNCVWLLAIAIILFAISAVIFQKKDISG